MTKEDQRESVWTTEATTVFECHSWSTVLKTAENKMDEKVLRRIRRFDFFGSETRFHSNVAGSIRESQLTGGVQMKKTR